MQTVQRKSVHLRRISVEGFERSDGLIDIEGTLIDTKPFDIDTAEKIQYAGEPIHHMVARIAVDRDFTIVEAEARTMESPYAVCGEIAASYSQLVGLRIGPGFTKTVKRLFRGTLGCSHITELLPPMATAYYQIVWSTTDSYDGPHGGQTPMNGCHALRTDGPLVMKHFPNLYTAPAGGDTPKDSA